MQARATYANPSDSYLGDSRAYEGVLTRRVLAFCMDYLIIGLLLIPFGLVVLVLGLLTLGLGWFLFGVLGPAVALIYIAATLGGPRQATLGMRMMGIQLVRMDGQRVDPWLAMGHTIVFWICNFTVLVLLVPLFTDRKRMLHDLLLGTVVVREF